MNPRPDLLALTPDDLAVLTNRGTVKRAQREVDGQEVTAEWDADETGRVAAAWSDGVRCELPAGGTIKDARCTCPAAELCRHVVRTVFAWQQRGNDSAAARAQPQVWNPGTLTDEHLNASALKGLWNKAQQRWSEGVLVECVAGVKPSARFYDLGITVRFPVPGDARYAHCDCAQPAPCLHALLAVLAFRSMPSGQTAALVSSGIPQSAVDDPLLAEAERVVLRLIDDGVGGVAASGADRWRRTAASLHDAGLEWLAGAVDDVLMERDRYLSRDALFSPESLAMLAGEILIRCDALRRAQDLPRGFAGGWRSVQKSEIGYSRWMGLGSLVTVRRKSVTLAAFMQEADSGSLGAVMREVAAPGDAEPQDFAALARTGMVKGAGIRLLGSGQILTESCRRTPDNRLTFGRVRAQISTQAYEWEKLRAPVLVEDFAELRARLALLPPPSLRPRRMGEDFHVLPVAGNSPSVFDPATQKLTAPLTDPSGARATLTLPWHSRGASGMSRLVSVLSEDSVLFVSGHVTLTPAGLTILPAGVVLRGGVRSLIQPWVDDAEGAHGFEAGMPSGEPDSVLIPEAWRDCGALLSDLVVTGSRTGNVQAWSELSETAKGAGAALCAGLAGRIASSLRCRREGGDTTMSDVATALASWRMAVDSA